MNITRETIKSTLRNIMKEESEYQTFFKKALEKAGKSIPSMSDEEKKEFFNKIDAAWNAKGEKNEALKGNQHKLDVDGDGEIEASDLAALRAGKKANESHDCGCGCGGVTEGGCGGVTEAIAVGKMVKVVDNPHWEAAIGKKGPFRRKVKAIYGDSVFFTDGSNSDMKYVKESVTEGVSPKDMESIKGAVQSASSFMNIGSELKKLGMKYIFATSPMPIYVVQDKGGNRVGIVNKKYATKPDFVHGDTAVGVMENIQSTNEGIGTIALGVAGGLLLLKILKFVLKKVVGSIGMNVKLPKEKLLEIVKQTTATALTKANSYDVSIMDIMALQTYLKDEINAGRITTGNQIANVIHKAQLLHKLAKRGKSESVKEGFVGDLLSKVPMPKNALHAFAEAMFEQPEMKRKFSNPLQFSTASTEIKRMIDSGKLKTVAQIGKAIGNMKNTNESITEGRAFINAARKAKAEGKSEFEFNGKKYPVTIKESVNEIQYKDAVAKFNDELIKHPMVKKVAQHYKKTPAEIVKVLQQRLSTKGNRGGDTKEVSIDFKDTDSGITIKHKKSFNESVNEGKKRFKQQDGIGSSKYTISYHDGKKKHKDGSDFFDIKIFKNKPDLEAFKKDLVSKGFVAESVVNEDRNMNVKVKQLLDKGLSDLTKGNPNHQFAVMHILKSALTDANFHSEAKKVESIFSKAKYEGDPRGEKDVIGIYEEMGENVASICKWDGKDIVDAIGFYVSMTIGRPVGEKIEKLVESVNETIYLLKNK